MNLRSLTLTDFMGPHANLLLLVSPHVYAWARVRHFGCHSVILSVCHHGNSLSGLQT